MTCLDCQELLQRLLDGETTVLAPDLQEHLAQCPTCRGLHRAARVLLEGLKALPAAVPSPDFGRRLAGLMLEDRLARRRRVRARLQVTAALAASLLIMAIAGYFFLPFPRNTAPLPKSLAKESKTPLEAVPELNPDDSPRLTKAAQDARLAFSALSERWADQAKEQTKIFLAAATPTEFPDMDSLPEGAGALDLAPAAQSLQQAGQEVVDSLQPVAQTTRRALTYFIREMPVLEGKGLAR